MKKRVSFIVILIGIICILLAAGICLYNYYQSDRAYQNSQEILDEIKSDINKNSTEKNTDDTSENLFDKYKKDKDSNSDTIKSRKIQYAGQTISYCGYVTIPKLNIELPVISEWSYPGLRLSPCRYIGTAEGDDLIIAAHNYSNHFGNIKDLGDDDEIIFTDCDGKQYDYSVTLMEFIPGRQPSEMEKQDGDDWDITLFTCTLSGVSRVTIRAKLK